LLLKRLQEEVGFNPKVFIQVAEWAETIGLRRLAVALWCSIIHKMDVSEEINLTKMEYSLRCAKILGFSVRKEEGIVENPSEISGVVFSFILAKVLESKPKSTLRSAQTLHFYLLLLSRNPKLHWLFTNITSKINWDNPFVSLEYKTLPYVVRILPNESPKSFKALEIENKKEEEEEETNSASRIFIYDPRTALKKKSLNWVALRKNKVDVFLTNPLPFAVKIDRLSLQTASMDTVSTSHDFILPANAINFPAVLKLKPLSPGVIDLQAVEMTINKLCYANSLDSSCVSNIYKAINADNSHLFARFESAKTKDLQQVSVAESVPKIIIQVTNYVPEVIHFNENIHMEYKVSNVSKRIIKQVTLNVLVDFENAPSKSARQKIDNFELENGEVAFLDVFFHQSHSVSARLLSESPPPAFPDARRQRFVFVNENPIFRVYKITVEIEAMFSTNRVNQGVTIHEKMFKTYDFFGISLFPFQEKNGAVDLSESGHLCVTIENRENYLPNHDTNVMLIDTQTQAVLGEINLASKDRVILPMHTDRFYGTHGIDKWLEIAFQTREYSRSGIIAFDSSHLLPVH
jgi:hypothetical protein